MKHILVTGASTGIGYAIAQEYLSKGYHVYASVRKEADAERLKKELGAHLRPLIFDVTDQEAVDAAVRTVTAEIGQEGLAFLVNNAGIATSGPLMLQDLDNIRWQFEVNVIGVMRVTQAFLPLLGASRNPGFPPGRIIQISSVAGRMSAPFLGAYSGSKHALEGMSDSLRRELQLYGIDVIVIEPGAVKTPIWDKPSATDLSPFFGSDYEASGKKFQAYVLEQGRAGLDAGFLARKIREVSEKKKPKAYYAYAPSKFRNFTLPKILPPRVIDRAIKKALGLSPEGGSDKPMKGRFG